METNKEPIIECIGEYNGAPVYYHEEQNENEVAISFGPIEKDPNEGRIVMMPFKNGVEELKPEIINSETIGKYSVDKSRYSTVTVGDTSSTFEPAKPIGDPTKPYYADTGEPWVPFHTDYKVSFIVTGFKDMTKFIELHGEKLQQRINDRLAIYNNGDNESSNDFEFEE